MSRFLESPRPETVEALRRLIEVGYQLRSEELTEKTVINSTTLLPTASEDKNAIEVERYYTRDSIVIDRAAMSVQKGKTDIGVTKKEYQILNKLSFREGSPVKFSEFTPFFDYSGVEYYYSSLLVHVSRLRSKLGATSDDPIIKVKVTVGYVLLPYVAQS